jgi:methylmalonyl-CoA mutase
MLFSEFEPISSAAWREKIVRDLKGAKSLDDLTWHTPEGLAMQVFYHNDENATAPTLPDAAVHSAVENKWLIHEIIRVGDVKTANETALAALQGGAESLQLVLDNAITAADLQTLLDSVFIEMIHLGFSGQWVWRQPTAFCALLLPLITSRDIAPENVNITLAADPSDTETIQELLTQTADYQHFKCIDLYCTGNATQQIAQIIKAAKTLLQRQPLLANRLQISMPVGSSFMVEIAKIRAIRLLWHTHIDSKNPPIIHAYTAPNTLTPDADYNKIKATTQAMSAILGGADKITVTPSDTMSDPNSSVFARRMARNVQHILRLESHLDKVIDPAAGSYYIEEMTEKLVNSFTG